MQTSELIARVTHEVNRAYCAAHGDLSQPPWDEAPEWQRVSAVEGVVKALDNPGLTPEESHQHWMASKHADGWTFGEEKDAVAKTHPCLVPYYQLNDAQRAKDHIFLAVARGVEHVLDQALNEFQAGMLEALNQGPGEQAVLDQALNEEDGSNRP